MKRRSGDIACQQLVEKVTAYLEGALHDSARAAVERHLATCDHCAGYVAQVRRMLELTAETADPARLPDELVEGLVQHFHRIVPGAR